MIFSTIIKFVMWRVFIGGSTWQSLASGTVYEDVIIFIYFLFKGIF